MTKNLSSNVHFQFRLVKELKGPRPSIITKLGLAKYKERAKDDKTIDLLHTDREALKYARNYCSRSDKRKGLVPGQFLGLVVTKFTSESAGKPVPRTIPYRRIKGPRGRREPCTTTWLYYIEPQSCQAFFVDTTPSGKHFIGEPLS